VPAGQPHRRGVGKTAPAFEIAGIQPLRRWSVGGAGAGSTAQPLRLRSDSSTLANISAARQPPGPADARLREGGLGPADFPIPVRRRASRQRSPAQVHGPQSPDRSHVGAGPCGREALTPVGSRTGAIARRRSNLTVRGTGIRDKACRSNRWRHGRICWPCATLGRMEQRPSDRQTIHRCRLASGGVPALLRCLLSRP